MIVRISGEGQYELDDEESARLEEMDREITAALHAGDAERFHALLEEALAYVRKQGDIVGQDQVVPSQIIMPPSDVTVDEAHKFFEDDSAYTEPLPA
jgi:hypothetical protein